MVKKLKRGQKSPEASWRFLHHNDNLRAVLEFQAKVLGMGIAELAKAADIATPQRISRYFKGIHKSALNELQIVRLCDVLNVEIDLNIKVVK